MLRFPEEIITTKLVLTRVSNKANKVIKNNLNKRSNLIVCHLHLVKMAFLKFAFILPSRSPNGKKM